MTNVAFYPRVPGDFLPLFSADSSINPHFEFGAVGGRNTLLCFVGSCRQGNGERLLDQVIELMPVLRQKSVLIYFVTVDPDDRNNPKIAANRDRLVAFWDADAAIYRKYNMIAEPPQGESRRMVLRTGCFIGRPNFRMECYLSSEPSDTFADRVRAAISTLPDTRKPLTQMSAHPPVLVIPNVFGAELCRMLIELYDQDGGGESGFMLDRGGMTRGFIDHSVKRRRDVGIKDPHALALVRRQIQARIVPEIRKAFSFEATHIERFLIGRYDSKDRGFFRSHRDNGGAGTAHRRFAVTLNLNAGEYEGGQLWFPEYGNFGYSGASGDAVVFSCSLLHEARPVTQGQRYAFIPFLYDKAAAEIRRKNMTLIDRNDPVTEMTSRIA